MTIYSRNARRAYVAGILDGEGCLSLGVRKRSGRKYIIATLQVTNTNRALLEWLAAYYGGGIYTYNRGQETKRGRKRTWLWSIAAEQAMAVIRDVYPYLMVKKPQADLLLSIPRHEPYRDTATGRLRVRMTDKDFAENERLIEKMRLLNKRGIFRRPA